MKAKKILVFAHVPPPHHGQSVMVQALLDGLRADQRFEVYHVDARVSDDLEDLGSFRPGKLLRLLKYITQTWWIRLRHGRMAFYYVPAPAKRSAILRDWVVMALCRPFFPELILHWHAYGLGEWVAAGNDWPRKLTRGVLGNATLAIVLNDYNKRDAAVFDPKRIKVVPNGVADQFSDYDESLRGKRKARAAELNQWAKADSLQAETHTNILENVGMSGEGVGPEVEKVRFLFLGHLIESKGVFVAIEAVALANEKLRKTSAPWRAELNLAGGFASEGERVRMHEAMEAVNLSSGDEGPCVFLAGFLDSGQKKSALERADCLVFPTFYENEAQPLVLLEAMSAGLPIITTSWRGVAEPLPLGYPLIVEPHSASSLARAMVNVGALPSAESLRATYISDYKMQLFAPRMADILLNVS